MMVLDKQKGLKSLSKEKRQKLEAYQHLFYLLQVSQGLQRRWSRGLPAMTLKPLLALWPHYLAPEKRVASFHLWGPFHFPKREYVDVLSLCHLCSHPWVFPAHTPAFLTLHCLQTQPIYLARLIFQMPQNKTTKFMESVIFSLYNYASNRREAYLLLQLFKTALQEEIK